MAQGGRNLQHKLVEEENETLKYLEFFHAAVLRTLFFIFNFYRHAKAKSGPIKLGVEFVEKMVEFVVRPVYDDLVLVFMELLKFIDNKIDKAVVKLHRRTPPILHQTFTAAHQAPAAAQAWVYEARQNGVLKSIYTTYEPAIRRRVVWTWCVLNRLPLFRQLATMVVPTVGYCLEKYNDVLDRKSVSANCLPVVPTEKVVKVFMGEEAAEAVRGWRQFCAPRTCCSFFA